MKVDKAPQPHYFKHGWIEFHKTRKGDLYYFTMLWSDDGENLALVDKGKITTQQELEDLKNTQFIEWKELQSIEGVEYG